MKMTKIESARIIVEQEGSCVHVECEKCFTTREKCGCKKLVTISWTARKLALAKAYIKRHESKSKKKDHILDTTKKVTRPNFRKYLRDNIDMKVRVTPELVSELEKICAEEAVYHWNRQSFKIFLDNPYMLINSRGDCEYSVVFSYKDRESIAEYNPETDTLVEKVEEPKPIKTVGIDNSDVTLAQYEPTPLQIAKMIRDNECKCAVNLSLKTYSCEQCPLHPSRVAQLCGTGFKGDTRYYARRVKLIDDYISASEPVVKESTEPKPVFARTTPRSCGKTFERAMEILADKFQNNEIKINWVDKEPQPIRVDIPDIFYCPTPQGILRFKRSHIILKDTNNEDCLLKYRDEYPCYRTLEEALQVAKKLWSGDGK